MQEALFCGFSLKRHVPDNHLLRKIDRFVDLSEVRAHLEPYYSETGRQLMTRMLIVGYCFGIRSERRLCEEVRLNLAYRWFCRLGLDGDVPGERRRTRSLDERKRIVEEALAPGISVAAVARRHGLNANLIFKWIRRSREGWRDRRREPAKEKPVVAALPERGGSAFVPVKLLELDAASAPPPSDVAAKPARQTRRGARRQRYRHCAAS